MCLSAPPPQKKNTIHFGAAPHSEQYHFGGTVRQQLQPETLKAKYACIIEIGDRRGEGGGVHEAWYTPLTDYC